MFGSEVFALLRLNGAGKITAVRIVTTLPQPDWGQMLVHGTDVTKEPDRFGGYLGVSGQYVSVDNELPRLSGHFA